MQKFIAFSFILLLLAAEISAHGITPSINLSINNSQVQIFFALIGMLTCLLGSLWLLTKFTMQREATKAGLHAMTTTPLDYQKPGVVIEMSGSLHRKKRNSNSSTKLQLK